MRLSWVEIPSIKFIFMSGYTKDSIPGGISGECSINFLAKPVSLQERASKVKEDLLEQ